MEIPKGIEIIISPSKKTYKYNANSGWMTGIVYDCWERTVTVRDLLTNKTIDTFTRGYFLDIYVNNDQVYCQGDSNFHVEVATPKDSLRTVTFSVNSKDWDPIKEYANLEKVDIKVYKEVEGELEMVYFYEDIGIPIPQQCACEPSFSSPFKGNGIGAQ